MTTIFPFRAIRYNPDQVDSLSNVIAPPYDVISPEEQEELYNISPYNIIRLEYGKEQSGDHEEDNRYIRAKNTLEQWMNEKVLIREEKPVFYWYQQEFTWNEQVYRREGLIAALKTEPYGDKAVLPHEETLSKPKEDRYQLLNHCKTNFSPVFGLYPDSEMKIDEECKNVKNNSPLMDFTDFSGQHHRIWTIENENLQNKIREIFKDFTVFLADGHHRYETSLQFARDMEEKGYPGYDTVLAVMVNLYSPNLLLLPTHRVVTGIENLDYSSIISYLQEKFTLEEWGTPGEINLDKFQNELKQRGQECFTFGFCTPEKVYLAQQKEKYQGKDDLDVSLLQENVLETSLGLTPESIKSGDNLIYTKSAEEALEIVNNNEAQASFILNPPHVEQIISLSQKNARLPQKSTYFYPKLVSGLALNKLD